MAISALPSRKKRKEEIDKIDFTETGWNQKQNNENIFAELKTMSKTKSWQRKMRNRQN